MHGMRKAIRLALSWLSLVSMTVSFTESFFLTAYMKEMSMRSFTLADALCPTSSFFEV